MPLTSTSWLSNYNTEYGNDEMFNALSEIKPYWKKLLTEFESLGVEGSQAARKI